MVSSKKILGLSLGVIFGLNQLLAGCVQSKPQGVLTPTPTPLPTLSVPAKPTYPVERGEIIDQVIFSGRIVPVKQQELYFKVSGRVRKTYVQEGDVVKAGDILADLESADQVGRAQALQELRVKRAQIRLDMAKVELETYKSTGAVYSSDYVKTLFMLSSQVSLAQLDLDETNMTVLDITKNLTDAQIIAPFDGEILTLSVEDGKQVVEYAPVAVIADVNSFEISADMSTEITGRIAEKMKATIESSDVSSTIKPTNGTIRRMPYAFGGTSTDAASKDKTVRITTDIPPEQLGYKLGNLVKITVVLQKKENVLILPLTAVREFGGRTFVLVKNGTVQERVDVKMGVKELTRVEILEGVKEGMVVIAP